MTNLIGMVKKPCEWLDINILENKGQTQSPVIAVEEKRLISSNALIIGIMVAVMAQNEDKVLESEMPQGEMPVEPSPLMTIIMGDELGHERSVPGEINDVLKPEIPSVFGPEKVVVAGKSGRVKEAGEEFSVEK